MSYEVLARKWRPQQFADVVGQDHVTGTLRNAIATGRIAHAYLFVGPRGVGKTTLARIFAKALNCEKGPTDKPCDQCDVCREIMSGNSMDVLEIDGASNNSVDQIRDLRENVKYVATRGRYRIYIIDEVHMLSTSAFNALLKTLEEPPAHVKFLFATTEPQKIPATIISRCQRFDLRRIPTTLLVDRLALIAKAEGVEADADALLAIARGAEGGMRDAQSALDQLIAFRGKRLTEEDVLSVFGLVSRRQLERLADAVLAGDVPTLFRLVADLDAGGKDMARLLTEILDHFRHLLVMVSAPNEGANADIVESQHEALRRQAEQTDTERVLRICDLLLAAEDRIRYALSKRTLVETTLLQCSRAARTVSLDALVQRLEALAASRLSGEPAQPVGGASARPSPSPLAAPARASVVRESLSASSPRAPEGDELALLTRSWRDFVERVAHAAPLARGALVDARPLEVGSDRVVIGFDPEFASEAERMRVPRNHTAAQQVLSQILKRPVTLECRLLAAGEEAPRADQPAGDTGPAARPNARRNWMEDPAVRKAMETFNGTILDIRE